MLPVLRDDALTSTGDGFALRVSLPWIRSLPLASLTDLAVTIDGTDAEGIRILLGDRAVTPADLGREPGWWYLQDRLVVVGDRAVAGRHRVAVSFRLLVPYLPGGPGVPLVLPFDADAALTAEAPTLPWAGRDVA